MNVHRTAIADHRSSEAFAAELAATAYPVVLRHGAGEKWLDLELDLWRALTEALNKWERKLPQA
jgi:hypothetical protein